MRRLLQFNVGFLGCVLFAAWWPAGAMAQQTARETSQYRETRAYEFGGDTAEQPDQRRPGALSPLAPGLFQPGQAMGDMEPRQPGDVSANRQRSAERPQPPVNKTLPDRPISQFQRFVFESTGRYLQPFGAAALQSELDISSAQNLPVSADYEIAAGDQVLVRVWGSIDVNHSAVVDRDGQLAIPSVGTFPVAGVRARDLDDFLTAQVGRYFRNFKLSATLGKLSGVNVFVAGQALAPGQHLVSSTSTLASVVFSVAQPGANGSFRNVQLKRGGKTVGTFDLYDLLRKGELNGDMKLRAGDVIFIGQVGPRVALNLDGPAAAIFELKPGETLADILQTAGVDQTLIRQDTVLVEGFNARNPRAPRGVEQLSYSRALNQAMLQDGDVVTLFPVRREFSNAVTLKGHVASPARYPHFEGMRISDLIPDTSALIQENYFRKKGELVGFDKNRAEKALNSRKLRDQLDVEPSRLPNGKLEREAELEQRQGLGQPRETGFGHRLEAVEESITTMLDDINWDYAVIERLDRKELKTRLIPFNLRQAMAADPKQNLTLLPGDVVTVFSAADGDIPQSRTTALVKVTGEVNAPGYYQITPGETLRDVIAKAGGLADKAFLFGTRLSRKSIIAEQEKQKKVALEQAERMLVSANAKKSASAITPADAAGVQQQTEMQRAYLERLRNLKPEGRVVLDIHPDASRIAELPPLELLDGDVVSIPPMPGQIAVFGSVYSQGSYAYEKGSTVFSYLAMAGGAARGADEGSIFVIRANGKVDSAQQGWVPFVSGLYGKRALPGDAIYVPEDFERVSLTKTLLDISQIFYQVGLGAAAVNALKD